MPLHVHDQGTMLLYFHHFHEFLSEMAVRPEKEARVLDRVRKGRIGECERMVKRGRTRLCMGSDNKRKGSGEKKTKSYFHKNSFWKTARQARSTLASEASLHDYFGISKRESHSHEAQLSKRKPRVSSAKTSS